MKIIQAQQEHLDIVRELFREYQADSDQASSCGCFADFDDELSSLPGRYSHPKGIIYIAFTDANYNNSNNAIGCIAVRPRDKNPQQAEIKRLYVRPNRRALGAGKQLLNNVFMFAKTNQYSALFLETTASMQAVKSLYEAYGFEPTKDQDNNNECYQYLFKQDEK